MTYRETARAAEYATIIVFFALCAYFLTRPAGPNWPDTTPQAIAAADIVRGPYRTDSILTDPPQAMINGFVRDCNDCHRLMKPPIEAARRLTQHTHLILDHGLNDRCFNCHAREDRNRLVLQGGKTVGFDQVEQLCAQCHGPTYRDWERGVHGKSMGSWVMDSPQRVRLTCVECHDPHTPRYASMAPLPGPNTLRMGEQNSEGEHQHEGDENPLRRYRHEQDWPYEPIHIGVEEEPTPYDTESDSSNENAEPEGDH